MMNAVRLPRAKRESFEAKPKSRARRSRDNPVLPTTFRDSEKLAESRQDDERSSTAPREARIVRGEAKKQSPAQPG